MSRDSAMEEAILHIPPVMEWWMGQYWMRMGWTPMILVALMGKNWTKWATFGSGDGKRRKDGTSLWIIHGDRAINSLDYSLGGHVDKRWVQDSLMIPENKQAGASVLAHSTRDYKFALAIPSGPPQTSGFWDYRGGVPPIHGPTHKSAWCAAYWLRPGL